MMERLLLSLFVLFLLFSCNPTGNKNDVSTALKLSGDNRIELQKVLDHYSKPEDSLKLRAAEYLITNMAGKYTERAPPSKHTKTWSPGSPKCRQTKDSILPASTIYSRNFKKRILGHRTPDCGNCPIWKIFQPNT